MFEGRSEFILRKCLRRGMGGDPWLFFAPAGSVSSACFRFLFPRGFYRCLKGKFGHFASTSRTETGWSFKVIFFVVQDHYLQFRLVFFFRRFFWSSMMSESKERQTREYIHVEKVIFE